MPDIVWAQLPALTSREYALDGSEKPIGAVYYHWQ
jgi:hypothetical protein